MNHKQEDNRLAVILAVLGIVALTLVILFAGPDESDAAPPPRLECFPVILWDANPAARPCHQIVSVEEDGSGRLELGTARRAIARCSIPNVREQRRTFTIKCWKVN